MPENWYLWSVCVGMVGGILTMPDRDSLDDWVVVLVMGIIPGLNVLYGAVSIFVWGGEEVLNWLEKRERRKRPPP